MESRTNVFLSVLVMMVVMSTPQLFAQHNHTTSQEASPDMMQECQKHHSEMASRVDQMSKTLADAREQGDVEAMRAAIDKTQAQLTEMKEQMSMCPMARVGASDNSEDHMNHMKCMSGEHNGEEKQQNSN